MVPMVVTRITVARIDTRSIWVLPSGRTKAGRARVDVMLKDIENHESRLPAAHRFDFSHIRRELRLDP